MVLESIVRGDFSESFFKLVEKFSAYKKIKKLNIITNSKNPVRT